MTKFTAAERDRRLREITAELKRIRDIPIRSLPDDAVRQIITARNFLRSIERQRAHCYPRG